MNGRSMYRTVSSRYDVRKRQDHGPTNRGAMAARQPRTPLDTRDELIRGEHVLTAPVELDESALCFSCRDLRHRASIPASPPHVHLFMG